MITEDRMRALFAEANPIPDEAALVLDEREVTAYLATLEQRSSEVSQQSSRSNQPSRHRGLAWGMAIFAAALAVAGLYVALSGDEDQETSPASDLGPTSTSTSIATTTTAEDAAPPEIEGSWTADLGRDIEASLQLLGSTYAFHRSPDAGRISVDGDLIEFFNSSMLACEGTGAYRWSLEGDTLTFTAVEPLDPCSERKGVLDGKEYTR